MSLIDKFMLIKNEIFPDEDVLFYPQAVSEDHGAPQRINFFNQIKIQLKSSQPFSLK